MSIEDYKKDRLNICNKCIYLVKSAKICKKCMCFVKVKTFIPTQKCPINKWEAANYENIDTSSR